ncbi:hypothetical protein D3C71_2018390 [compost metagenome]
MPHMLERVVRRLPTGVAVMALQRGTAVVAGAMRMRRILGNSVLLGNGQSVGLAHWLTAGG